MPRREGSAMSLEAIQRYNETLLETLGEDAGLRDLDALREGVPRATLRTWLGDFSPPEAPCWEDTRPLSSVDWFPILENRDLSVLPERILPRWGMVTERCALRPCPRRCPSAADLATAMTTSCRRRPSSPGSRWRSSIPAGTGNGGMPQPPLPGAGSPPGPLASAGTGKPGDLPSGWSASWW